MKSLRTRLKMCFLNRERIVLVMKAQELLLGKPGQGGISE
jgi:hypothetical protein